MRINPKAGNRYVLGGDVFDGAELGVKPVPSAMKPHVAGVYVGGCIERGLGRTCQNPRDEAHAHIEPNRASYHWVCFQRPGGLADKQLCQHELAHILTDEQYHTDAWRAALRQLGEPIPPRYQKKARRKRS